MRNGTSERVAPYIERFFDNEYARENLQEAMAALGDAYRRVSKKGAAAPADRRFRDRLTDATVAFRDATDAIQSGRRRPKGQRARRVLMIGALMATAAGVALAASEELRNAVFGPPADEGIS